MEVDAAMVARSHDCKTPGCEGEARSAIGRYAYCTDCQEKRAAAKATPPPGHTNGHAAGFAAQISELSRLAKQVDKAKAKAEAAQKTANRLGREADDLEVEFRKVATNLMGGA